jgi:hypothetical protein
MKQKTAIWLIIGIFVTVILVSNLVSGINAVNSSGLGNGLFNVFGGPMVKP